MSPAASNLSVLFAPLPSADRRALSQAWYSALHLASVERTERAGAQTRGGHAAGTAARCSPSRSGSATVDFARAYRPAGVLGRATPGAQLAPERRGEVAPLARKVARALRPRLSAHAPASVVISTESGRIHLVVRRDGSRLRVFALCTPALREGVERALAQARYALAGAGTQSC